MTASSRVPLIRIYIIGKAVKCVSAYGFKPGHGTSALQFQTRPLSLDTYSTSNRTKIYPAQACLFLLQRTKTIKGRRHKLYLFIFFILQRKTSRVSKKEISDEEIWTHGRILSGRVITQTNFIFGLLIVHLWKWNPHVALGFTIWASILIQLIRFFLLPCPPTGNPRILKIYL
ncbi:hypothetical protein ACJX0J_021006 [Zea mays]